MMTSRDTTTVPLASSCIAVGAFALWFALDYGVGSARAMGPGFIPVAVALALIGLGLVILSRRGRDVPGGGADEPRVAPLAILRAMACVIGAILVFAAAIRPLGLAATLFLVVAIAGHAPSDARTPGVLVLAAALSAGACALFVGLLGLQIAVLPRAG